MDEVSLYLDLVERVLREDPQQREGQAHMNALQRQWPDLAKQIAGTDLDPFSLDHRLPVYLAWVERQLGSSGSPADR
ncbi:hypothetical protein [Kibdelosporangium phytohabitans]|uniref:Uncharacterized protein n=1 Tax=Kibdelosporangium phytohabitans TaxID=860235 RepID=A0A0N9HQA2_9PSEU|nr:hypothetical protein [Kibdelosporangium phytohabitans]ALG06881.1 hypothetical protein AOZ06_08000 [Kibdelosporangium phytohabitans]MBE1468132.1 hypothetical protein [Kibdelosporangium phytohabitans]